MLFIRFLSSPLLAFVSFSSSSFLSFSFNIPPPLHILSLVEAEYFPKAEEEESKGTEDDEDGDEKGVNARQPRDETARQNVPSS